MDGDNSKGEEMEPSLSSPRLVATVQIFPAMTIIPPVEPQTAALPFSIHENPIFKIPWL